MLPWSLPLWINGGWKKKWSCDFYSASSKKFLSDVGIKLNSVDLACSCVTKEKIETKVGRHGRLQSWLEGQSSILALSQCFFTLLGYLHGGRSIIENLPIGVSRSLKSLSDQSLRHQQEKNSFSKKGFWSCFVFLASAELLVAQGFLKNFEISMKKLRLINCCSDN